MLYVCGKIQKENLKKPILNHNIKKNIAMSLHSIIILLYSKMFVGVNASINGCLSRCDPANLKQLEEGPADPVTLSSKQAGREN